MLHLPTNICLLRLTLNETVLLKQRLVEQLHSFHKKVKFLNEQLSIIPMLILWASNVFFSLN